MPREINSWKSLYKKLYTYISGRPIRPQLAHLKVYRYRAYTIILATQLKKKRLIKLDPRVYIGCLIRYNSTNIYRIQIPYKGIVISTRDIIFNKSIFFNGKQTDLLDKLIAKLDILIEKVKLPKSQARNKALLKEDEEILELAIGVELNNDNEPIQDFN